MIKTITAIIFAGLVLYCIYLLGGCLPIVSPGQTQTGMIAAEPNTPQQILYKTVYKTDWLVSGCLVGIGICTTAFLLGSKQALFGAGGCLATLAMTLATIAYAKALAVIAIVCAICLCVWVVLTRRKALTEIIRGVQVFKDNYNRTGTLDALKVELAKQSKSTKTIVKDIKKIL